jgi:hypothetical protein
MLRGGQHHIFMGSEPRGRSGRIDVNITELATDVFISLEGPDLALPDKDDSYRTVTVEVTYDSEIDGTEKTTSYVCTFEISPRPALAHEPA